ncbi:MAG: hypothetical protein AB7S26_13140 [Sandaracinaceae bacterium]
MSTVQCRCGHVLPDVTERLPYKGYLHVDEHDEAYWGGIVRETLALIRSHREEHTREGLLDKMLPSAPEADDDDPAAALAEALSEHAARYTRSVFACEACGRLLVETAPASGTFRSFVPEDEDRAVLASGPEPTPSA